MVVGCEGQPVNAAMNRLCDPCTGYAYDAPGRLWRVTDDTHFFSTKESETDRLITQFFSVFPFVRSGGCQMGFCALEFRPCRILPRSGKHEDVDLYRREQQ